VQFAILRFNDDAPASGTSITVKNAAYCWWRLWKRYMLVDVKEQEVTRSTPKR